MSEEIEPLSPVKVGNAAERRKKIRQSGDREKEISRSLQIRTAKTLRKNADDPIRMRVDETRRPKHILPGSQTAAPELKAYEAHWVACCSVKIPLLKN